MTLLTDFQKKRASRDAKIRKEWYKNLEEYPEISRTALRDRLMAKYDLHSTSHFYTIINEC